MIDKTVIKKILNGALRRSRGQSDHNLMHPTREWFSGLGVASVLLIIGTIVCVFLYWEYNTIEPETGAEIDAPAKIYQEGLVADALRELTDRAARLDEQRRLLEANRVIPIPPPEPDPLPETPPETATSTTSDTQPASIEPEAPEPTSSETGIIEVI